MTLHPTLALLSRTGRVRPYGWEFEDGSKVETTEQSKSLAANALPGRHYLTFVTVRFPDGRQVVGVEDGNPPQVFASAEAALVFMAERRIGPFAPETR